MQSAQKACSHLTIDPDNDFWFQSLDHLLRRKSGILEDRAADRADELLVHRALKPDDIIAHDRSSAKRTQSANIKSTIH